MNKQSNNSPLYTVISILNFAKTWTFWSQLVLGMLITMPTTFSLPSLTGSSFINRHKIIIKQDWVQLFGATLHNVPSFSRGSLGKLIAHCCLWWMYEGSVLSSRQFILCCFLPVWYQTDWISLRNTALAASTEAPPTRYLDFLIVRGNQPEKKHCLKGRGTRTAQLRWTESLN